MGFPEGYSELLLPRMLLRIALLLGYVRGLIFLAFNAVGLGDLLDVDLPWPDNSSSSSHDDGQNNSYRRHNQQQQLQSSASGMLTIQQALPVALYEELARPANDGCAVCLSEFEHGDEVRPLSNCRHVFHRGCLDRWVEHEQSTCPLCRTPLVPGKMWDAIGDGMLASVAAPDSYYDDYYSYSSSPGPTLILLEQLFSSS